MERGRPPRPSRNIVPAGVGRDTAGRLLWWREPTGFGGRWTLPGPRVVGRLWLRWVFGRVVPTVRNGLLRHAVAMVRRLRENPFVEGQKNRVHAGPRVLS